MIRSGMIKPWPTLSSRKLANYRIFDVRADLKKSPRTGIEMEMYVIEAPSWINVVALTPERELVMVEQYRHGSDTVELEVPGGVMDASDESPEVCGARELREETGFEGSEARVIGRIFSNPAIMNNVCYTILIEDCVMKHPVQLDPGEDLATKLVPWDRIPDLMREGRIGHSLVAVALFHYELHRLRSAE